MFLHALQLAISINLESVFYLWYIVYLSVTAVNNSIMNAEISAMPCLPSMQQPKLLMLHWHSFSVCGREHVAVVFASEGCQCWINGCLQPIRKKITQDSKLKFVDALLTIILRMRQGACRCSFPSKGYQYLMNASLQPIGTQITHNARLKFIHSPLTLILRMRQGACRGSFSQWRLSISDKRMSTTNRNMNFPRCEAENCWRSVDAYSQDAAGSMPP